MSKGKLKPLTLIDPGLYMIIFYLFGNKINGIVGLKFIPAFQILYVKIYQQGFMKSCLRKGKCQYFTSVKMKRNISTFSATVTSLQAKVESLATTNALMKEDLSITRTSNDKIQAENRKLKGELEKLRKLDKKTDLCASKASSSDTSSHQEVREEKKASFVQVKRLLAFLLRIKCKTIKSFSFFLTILTLL